MNSLPKKKKTIYRICYRKTMKKFRKFFTFFFFVKKRNFAKHKDLMINCYRITNKLFVDYHQNKNHKYYSFRICSINLCIKYWVVVIGIKADTKNVVKNMLLLTFANHFPNGLLCDVIQNFYPKTKDYLKLNALFFIGSHSTITNTREKLLN